MWFNIKDLYPKTLKNVFARLPSDKRLKYARFSREYGKPLRPRSGTRESPHRPGTVERYWNERGEGLKIPEELPSPADTLTWTK